MKQTIRMNEAELNRLISESVMRVLNEGMDEVGTFDSNDANINARPFRFFNRDKSRKVGYGGGSNKDIKAVDNMELYNNMSNPGIFSGVRDRISGMEKGFKRGGRNIDAQDKRLSDMGQDLHNSEQVRKAMQGKVQGGNEFGIDQRMERHNGYNNPKNNPVLKQKVLRDDIKQDIKQDVKKFDMMGNDVANTLKYVSNDFAKNPQNYGNPRTSSKKQIAAQNREDAQARQAELTRNQQAYQDTVNNSKYGFNGISLEESIDRAVSSVLRNLLK